MKKENTPHRKHKEKNTRTYFLFKTIMSFYLIWLLVILFILGVFQVGLKRNLTDFNYQYQLSVMNRGTEQMESRISSILQIVQQHMYRQELDPRIALGSNPLRMMQAKKELVNLVSAQKTINECILVSPRSNYAISNLSSYLPSIFFDRIQLDNLEPSERYDTLFAYLKAHPVAKGVSDGVPVISFHLPFQIHSIEDSYIMVIIPVANILQIFSESIQENEHALGMIFFNDILLQKENTEEAVFYSQIANHEYIHQNNHTYRKIVIDRPEWNLHFVYLIDNNFYAAPVSKTIFLCIIWLLIIFVLGTGLIVLVSYYKYRPIRRLHKLLEDHLELEQNDRKDEMRFIESGVDKLIQRNTQLSTAISVSKRNMNNFCLFKLLHEPHLTEEWAMAILKNADIQMDRQCFQCISITVHRLEDMENFLQRMEEERKSFSPLYLLYYLHSGTNIVLIFNYHLEDSKMMSYLLDRFSDFYVREVPISMGVGPQVEGICNIQESFTKSQMAMHYAEAQKELPMSHYTEIELSSIVEQMYSSNQSEELLAAIHKGDTEQISLEIEKIKQYIKQSGMPKHMIKAMFYQIINEVLSSTKNPALYEKGNELLMTIDETLQQYTVEEILDRIEELSCNIVNLTSGVILLDTVLDYISQHYADIDFSIANMADYFKMSHQSLINLFKREMHMTIIEYVTACKMTSAKDMLLHTDLAVSDIVKKLGYIDNSSFTRKFKSIVGVTPVEYRKNHMKE